MGDESISGRVGLLLKSKLHVWHNTLLAPFRSYFSVFSWSGKMPDRRTILSAVVVMLMLTSTFASVLVAQQSPSRMKPVAGKSLSSTSTTRTVGVPLPYTFVWPASDKPLGPYAGTVSVFLSMNPSNQTLLNSLLSSLSNPHSSMYHQYLTRSQFDFLFGSPSNSYNAAASYFSSFPGVSVTKYSDRLGLYVSGPASSIGTAFGIEFYSFRDASVGSYYAFNGTPRLPSTFAGALSGVDGLANYQRANFSLGYSKLSSSVSRNVRAASIGYPAPINYNGTQLLYGADMQVTYDEQSLLNITYPSNEVVATILWSGQNSGGTNVGPFVPSDISSYFNGSLPGNQPRPQFHAVPINNAPPPGESASYDVTSANLENTLDVEMVGSMAPGASIYTVYGPSPNYSNLDSAFSTVLNPTSAYKGLDNVSVISNSWGGSDHNDSTWYNLLQEAAARGITVLAASGDSGNNQYSSKWFGSEVWYPSSMAYNNFGVLSVGGTDLTVNDNSASANYLHRLSEVVWNISSQDTLDGGPVGTTGGISTVFPAPVWQNTTSANSLVKGAGRGTPDIAGIANNTLINLSYQGTMYLTYVWGTSIASPLYAGMFAEINAVLAKYNQPDAGFVTPSIYALANEMNQPLTNGTSSGYAVTGSYSSPLPTLPFYDITSGRNLIYHALPGYDFVTGWGSIDASNLTMYLMRDNESGMPFSLSGVRDVFNLSGLAVTSYYGNGTVNSRFNASIQQNFMVASSLGAPIYWVQNVVYLAKGSGQNWVITDTGWVVFPFYGLYPSYSIYEYNMSTSSVVTLPKSFNITSSLSTSGGTTSMNFQVNSQTLSLPLPGGEFIIGSLNYTYLWQGTTYTNGPYPGTPASGGLSPQFGLVGGPSLGNGNFSSPTAGTLATFLQATGTGKYLPASGSVFNMTGDQTGETASNLLWSGSGDNWTVGIQHGSAEQGVVSYASKNGSSAPPKVYAVTFTESGLQSGSGWNVTVDGNRTYTSYSSTLTIDDPNGSYHFTLGGPAGYTISPSNGTFVVNGSSVKEQIAFTPIHYSVNFTESGLTSGSVWAVNINFVTHSSNSTSINFSEIDGNYAYAVSTSNPNYTAPGGQFTVSNSNTSIHVAFVLKNYTVTFTESGLPTGLSWSVTLNGTTANSTGSSIAFKEHSGTYLFAVGTLPGYMESPVNGTVAVDGAATSVNVNFTAVTYIVSVNESGLPAGTLWTVYLGSNLTFGSSSSVISFLLPNGTYTFTLNSQNSLYTSPGGVFTVDGANLSFSVAFTMVMYNVTFVESGLPANTNWSVTLNGETVYSTTFIVFQMSNGTYSYDISNVSNYVPSTPTGTVIVAGSPASIDVFFGAVLIGPPPLTTYAVTFKESGLSSNTQWAVDVNGNTRTSFSQSIVFNLANGSYPFSLYNETSANQTMKPSIAAGTVVVNGNNVTQAVTFTAITSSKPPPKNPHSNSSTLPYEVGLAAVILVVVTSAAISAHHRRRN